MEHPEIPEMGSINDIKKRLLLWAKRSPKGLARVEFSSEFSRQKVLEEMRTTLAEAEITMHEVVLPSQQEAIVVVEKLLEELNQIKSGVVSIAGFSTAFTNKIPLEESIRVFNFHRDRLVAPNLNQIWWMTPAFLQTSIHAMPDINSWFGLRLHLKEMLLNELDPSRYIPISPDGTYSNIDDARRRVHNLLNRFQKAQLAGISDLDLLTTYLLPALEILAKVGAKKELYDLTLQFQGLLGQLKLTNSPEMAASLDHLAGIYYSQGRYSDAELLYLRALEVIEQHFGVDHPSVAASANNLAELYRLQARYSEAENLYLKALAIWEKIDVDNPSFAATLSNLGLLYTSQERYKESQDAFLKSLKIMEMQGDSVNFSAMGCLHNLGLLYKLEGDYSTSEKFLLRALDGMERKMGADHTDVAPILNTLAGLYYSQGRYSEVESLYLRSLNIVEQKLGRDHYDTAIRLNNLAIFYSSQQRYSEAEVLYLRSVNILERLLGKEHPYVASSLNNLAVLYINMEQFTKAESLLIKSLALRKKVLGEEHPDTIRTQESLMNVRAKMI